MGSIVDKYIHSSQSGFLKNRYLKDNLSRICNLIDFMGRTANPVLMFFVEAEKAFDHVKWRLIEAVISRMGWGHTSY